MKKYFLGLLVFILSLFSVTCFAGLRDCPNVAVIPFTNKASMPTVDGLSGSITLSDASIASDTIIEELIDTGRFNLAERESFEDVLRELYNGTSGVTGGATMQVGKQLGAEYLILGSVANCSAKINNVGYTNERYGQVGNKQYVVEANVTLRFVEVSTGRIVLAARGKGKSTSTKTEISYMQAQKYGYDESEETGNTHTISFGAEEVSQVQVHNAINKAAQDAVYGKNGILDKLDGVAKKKRRRR